MCQQRTQILDVVEGHIKLLENMTSKDHNWPLEGGIFIHLDPLLLSSSHAPCSSKTGKAVMPPRSYSTSERIAQLEMLIDHVEMLTNKSWNSVNLITSSASCCLLLALYSFQTVRRKECQLFAASTWQFCDFTAKTDATNCSSCYPVLDKAPTQPQDLATVSLDGSPKKHVYCIILLSFPNKWTKMTSPTILDWWVHVIFMSQIFANGVSFVAVFSHLPCLQILQAGAQVAYRTQIRAAEAQPELKSFPCGFNLVFWGALWPMSKINATRFGLYTLMVALWPILEWLLYMSCNHAGLHVQ